MNKNVIKEVNELLDRIFKFYEGKIDIVGAVLKQYKWWWRGFWLIFIITSLDLMLHIKSNNNSSISDIPLLALLSVIIFIFNLGRHRRRYVKLIEERFFVKVHDFDKARKILFEIKIQQLLLFTKQQGIGTHDKIKMIIEMINKETTKRRLPKYFVPGLFLAMFIPVWAQIIRIVYEFNISLNDSIGVTIILIFVIFIIVMLVGFFKSTYEEFKYSILDNKIEKLIELEKLLQEVLLRIENN